MSQHTSSSGETKVVLISGKRFAGKDTFAQLLKKYFEEKQNKLVHLMHFADECKRLFAIQSGTDYQRLLNDREYKVRTEIDFFCIFHIFWSFENTI